ARPTGRPQGTAPTLPSEPRQREPAPPEDDGVDQAHQHVALASAGWGRLQLRQRVLQGVLLSRQAFYEVAPDDLAAVFHAHQGVTERAPVTSRQLTGDDAIAGKEQAGSGLVALLRAQRLRRRPRGP